MAKTGIKEYDELPSCRGLKDIDAIRAHFYMAKKKYDKFKMMLDDEIKFQKESTKSKDCKPIVLDDNVISIMKYAEEYPENWEKICESLDRKSSGNVPDTELNKSEAKNEN